ncbi:hypothetical protein BGZ83_005419 [Gryganskiella cystojenkinii]|nr:hypothetical protein BGZ83_005419 [Gryganskiella cystojenkinii]
MASYNVLDALGNLNLGADSEDTAPRRTRPSFPKKTFTRLTRTVPAPSPSAFLLSNTTLSTPTLQKPTRKDTTPSTSVMPLTTRTLSSSILGTTSDDSDHNCNIDTGINSRSDRSGLDRFRAVSSSSPLKNQRPSDYLDNNLSSNNSLQQQQPPPPPPSAPLFTAHRHYDRAEAQKAALSFLQESSVMKPSASTSTYQPLLSSPLSEENSHQHQAPVRSRATFTRISSKPRFAAFGSSKLGHSGSLLSSGGSGHLDNCTSSSCGSSITGDDDNINGDNDNNDNARSFSPLQEDPPAAASSSPSPSISASTSSTASSSPSAPPSLSPVLSSPPSSIASSSPPASAWSLCLVDDDQQHFYQPPQIQPRYHALPHYKAQAPSLSLSLSPPTFLSPPSSAVPSLSSASSSTSSSSSCSSLSSMLSSSSPLSSPPTKKQNHHFVFPALPAADRHSWWQQRPTPADLLSSPEELQFSGDPLAETPTTTTTTTAESDEYFGRGRPVSSRSFEEKHDPISPASEGSPLGSQGLGQEKQAETHVHHDDGCRNTNENFLLDCSDANCAPGLQQRRLNSRGFEQVKPKPNTTLSNRTTRTPSPPSVNTGFCSISCRAGSGSGSINSACSMTSGEPSPQDFLGEADLPYPLPSTLQERQARQRKRAEQLRQLKLREEREEARENWRRIRRRGASFTAGVSCSSISGSSSSSLSSSPSAIGGFSASSNSRPLSLSLSSSSSWVNNNASSPCRKALGTAATGGAGMALSLDRKGEQNHLKRSPSSPTKGNASSAKARRCVRFDLKRTKVFEYDVHEWTPCSTASTPASSSSTPESKDYFDLCRRGTPVALPQCQEDEDGDSDSSDEVRSSEVTKRYRRAAAVYPGSTRQLTF